MFNGTGEQRTVNRELAPTGATLRLRVVDGLGDPISGLDTRLEYIDLAHADTIMPVCTPSGPVASNPPPTGVTCPAGIYLFVGALPLTYTLSINGAGFLPLSMPQTMEAGVTATITVPLSKPGGSIQGTITRQDGAASAPAANADVALTPCPSGVTCTAQTNSQGYYSITQIPAGDYTLTASKDGLQASRGVQLGAAQGVTLDLSLVVPTATVPVTLNSVNGFDLTGALVTISEGNRVLGPQPVLRQSGSTFATSFTQVPYGTNWRIRVTGPAGHLGTYESAAFTVDGSGGAPPAMSIRETQLRIGAQGPSSAPSTVVATVGPSGDRREVTVPVGDQAVVYVSAETASTVTVTAPPGLSAQVTGGSIPVGTVTRAVTIVLSASTTTTVDLSSGFSVRVADGFDVPVTVKAGSTGVGGVDVDVQVDRGNGWTSAGTDTTDSGGAASVSVPAGDAAGTISVRAVFAGSSGYAASTSASVSVSVTSRPVTATLTWANGTRTLSAKATSSGGIVAGHGQLAIEQLVSGDWTSVASTSTVAGGELSVTYVVPGATAGSFRSRFVPAGDYYAEATSSTQAVSAAGP